MANQGRLADSDLASVTAAILAGGLGTRLRSVVADRPKVLAEIRGRPFLAYLLDQLAAAGVRTVVLCTGYLDEQVQATFGDAYGNLRLVYSQESSPLGTAGALRLALPLLESDPVMVLNGDSYCDTGLNEFVAWHLNGDRVGSLLLTWVEDTSRYGTVAVGEDGKVLGFHEKQGVPQPGWINAGVYLLSRELLNSIPADQEVSIEREVFPAWVGRGLRAYQVRAPFVDIGTPESYAEAQRFFHRREMVASSPRLVILDRDGTINVEKYCLADPNGVQLLPNAAVGIRRMGDLGLKVVVVTNQSAIGRGYFDRDTLERIHERLLTLLAAQGAMVDGIYICPHHPDENCACRKPRPGLLEQAAREFQADLALAFVIGDKAIDIEVGRRVGATTLLVRTGYGAEVAVQGGAGADYVVADLAEAAAVIEKLTRGQAEEQRSRGAGEQGNG